MEITIRSAEKSDTTAIRDLYAQPHAAEGTLQLPYSSVQVWEKRFDNANEHYVNLVAVHKEQVVGQLGFQPSTSIRRKHVADLGMAVRREFLGKGVGTKLMEAAVDLADNWMNILRIELNVFTDNEPAIRLYKKFGFEIEGEMKMYAFRNGTYANVYQMARIRNIHEHPVREPGEK